MKSNQIYRNEIAYALLLNYINYSSDNFKRWCINFGLEQKLSKVEGVQKKFDKSKFKFNIYSFEFDQKILDKIIN